MHGDFFLIVNSLLVLNIRKKNFLLLKTLENLLNRQSHLKGMKIATFIKYNNLISCRTCPASAKFLEGRRHWQRKSCLCFRKFPETSPVIAQQWEEKWGLVSHQFWLEVTARNALNMGINWCPAPQSWHIYGPSPGTENRSHVSHKQTFGDTFGDDLWTDLQWKVQLVY